jgi:hypothetical protein
MNCAEFEEMLHDMDRPGTDGSAQRESALAHAEWCSSCGRLLTEAEALDFRLHSLALQDANRQASPQLESALLREFRRRSGVPKRRRVPWYAVAVGLAAVALLTVALMQVRMGMGPKWPSHGVAVTRHSNARDAAVVTKEGPSDSDVNSAQNEGQLNELASSEDGTAFFPLPYADDTVSLEGGVVIRVAMPGSALASWGLPVTGVAGMERVPAELVVSADGTPQAIRLISEAND